MEGSQIFLILFLFWGGVVTFFLLNYQEHQKEIKDPNLNPEKIFGSERESSCQEVEETINPSLKKGELILPLKEKKVQQGKGRTLSY